MKRFVIAVTIACFLSVASLGQSTEIMKTPLSYDTQSMFFEREKIVMKTVDIVKVKAGGVDGGSFVLAAIGVFFLIGYVVSRDEVRNS
jgi:hypothetical protein